MGWRRPARRTRRNRLGIGCAAAAWPLAEEQSRLARADLPHLASGARLDPLAAPVVVLDLAPAARAGLVQPPQKRGEGFAALVWLAPAAAPYELQVSLSAAAWIDLLSGAHYVQPSAFTGIEQCPFIRKSIRVPVPAGDAPLALQVCGASAESLIIGLSAVK